MSYRLTSFLLFMIFIIVISKSKFTKAIKLTRDGGNTLGDGLRNDKIVVRSV